MDVALAPLFLLLGAFVGFLAGLLGIGGGLTIVPALTFAFAAQDGFPQEHVVHAAVATATATIMFTSVSSAREHHRIGTVLWGVIGALAPGVVIGSLLGPQLVGALPSKAFATMFGAFVAAMATQILLDRKPRPSRALPGRLALAAVGAGIGFVSSLVGAGGAFLTIPFLIWCNVPLRTAVSTAAALGLPIAVAATVGYAVAGLRVHGMPWGSVGYIVVPALVPIVVASVVVAPYGARLAHRWPVAKLRRAFAAMLYLIAATMVAKGVTL